MIATVPVCRCTRINEEAAYERICCTAEERGRSRGTKSLSAGGGIDGKVTV